MSVKKKREPLAATKARRVRAHARPSMVPFGEARSSLTQQIEVSSERDVIILRNSQPAAVLISYERYEALLDHIEDLEDRLSIVEREDDTVSFSEALGDLDSDS
ncbi:type II toxin-antitoxin system prevent-host-death family antitoxin [Nocardia sp.]|uniref:type II toxin-antitoxin system prevent-host-death family antitoxin n=1 Tax=Nocardia sp. TaxID=1821 RepID=UPI0026199800|nr:type II toxin-antitoxin system prevent-host-death family antitoxin [Nocardia sp.]